MVNRHNSTGNLTRFSLALAVLMLMTACQNTVIDAPPVQLDPAQLLVTSAPLAQPEPCTGSFVTHLLDHTTTTGSQVVALYESNGSGVAINDLDNDGDLDIVLANLSDPNTILWNQGDLVFRTQRLSHGDSRAVNIVDLEGDGWQDIVFTRRFAKPTLWRNSDPDGEPRFVEGVLPDVHNPLYSMNWGDVNGDGDLDLVAGSYDTELRKQQGAIFDYRGGGVGVFVYEREGEGFVAQRLAEQADALAIALPDLNGDGRADILVGNDFLRPDFAWLRAEDGAGWLDTQPFKSTSENTMSLDVGDVDNDGSAEIFATDMKPYQQDVRTIAMWLPVMNKMTRPSSSADPQTAENVLQVAGTQNRYTNRAYQRSLDATGWSWSSKFGDLNNDGFLDIYVVNGMIAEGILAHLPGNELVEENQALRNDGRGFFTAAPEWGLGSTASGRGMSMADLDNDGDLDIVANNLMSPAQLFENRLCGGASLEVDLRWPTTKNPFAIGAQLALHTSAGTFYRDVRAASGYLSGDPARIHFGLPADAEAQRLEIRWPDGALATIDGLSTNTLVTVQRR
jgi:uncharacterized protein YuzB (UPF0349 family)